MRRLLRLAGPLLGAVSLASCRSAPKEDSSTLDVHTQPQQSPELQETKEGRMISALQRDIARYQELVLQHQWEAARALRRAIGQTVDTHLDYLIALAENQSEYYLHRNPALEAIPFADKSKPEARQALMKLLSDPDATIVSNAALGLGILQMKDTDLSRLIELLTSGDARVRTNAAQALADLFLVEDLPRELNQQLHVAVNRLVGMLYDKSSVRGRRAAAVALANLHNPEVLDQLVAALKDTDAQVQFAALQGILKLGDQRAIQPLLGYLDSTPAPGLASWAVRALMAIAEKAGFTKHPAELEKLGTNVRAWKEWFEQQRSTSPH